MFFFVERILWFLAALSTAALCLAHYIPFAHEQVVRGNLFPILGTVARGLPFLIVVAVTLTMISLLKSVGKNKILRSGLWLIAVTVPFTAAVVMQTGMGSGLLSWWLGFAAVLLAVLPSAFDVWFAVREKFPLSLEAADFEEKDFHLFLSLLATATLVFGVSILAFGDLKPFSLAACGLTVLLVTMVAHAALTFLFRLAERSTQPLRAEWALCGALLALYLYWLLAGGLFPALAYTGLGQKLFSAAFAIAISVFLMALSSRINFRHVDKRVTGLQLLLAPLVLRSTSAAVTIFTIATATLAAVFLLGKVSLMDWNFLGQKIIVILTATIVLANLQWLLPMRAPQWFRIPYPFVLASLVLGTFVNLRASIQDLDAAGNVVYSMAKASLTSGEWALDETFSRFLQENSNIPKTMRIAPVEVKLSAEEQATGRLSPTTEKRYDVIMIVVDSLRPDYLEPYNPAATFTPAIGEFAKDAVIFRRAFTRYGATGLSEPSIWVGGMLVHQQYVLPFKPMNALQKMLEVNGYQILISRDSILSQIVTPGERVIDIDPGVSTQDLDLCVTLPKLRTLIKSRKNDEPLFAYTQPQNIHVSVLNKKASSETMQSFPGFHSEYATAIQRLDRCFGEFVSHLKEAKRFDDTIIVITADHGDSLGEDGRFGHAYTIFPEVMRIPMIVRLPKELRERWQWDVNELAFNIDVTPSLYALMGHPLAEPSWMWGKSLFWKTGETPVRRKEPTLLVSSYGAVYGILDAHGESLYIADAVNLKDYAYDLRPLKPATRDIASEEREKNAILIRSKIRDINQYYGFKGSNETQ